MFKPTEWEPTFEKQLQSTALHTVFTAFGGLNIFANEGTPYTVIDDTASVRHTLRHREDGKNYLYTTNVTVSVSRVEIE
jgi:hypothetical protein